MKYYIDTDSFYSSTFYKTEFETRGEAINYITDNATYNDIRDNATFWGDLYGRSGYGSNTNFKVKDKITTQHASYFVLKSEV